MQKLPLKVLLALGVVGIAFYVRGDLLPKPGMGDFPLHRIGIELILTSVAAAFGGGAVTKWLVKRGWKLEKDVTPEERRDIDQKIGAALPRLMRHSAAMRLQNTLKDGCTGHYQISLELILRLDPELLKDLEGVPIELIAPRLQNELRHNTATMENVSVIENCYWASPDEMSEWYDEVRKKKELEAKRRWLTLLILLIVLFPLVLWLAWWLWQKM